MHAISNIQSHSLHAYTPAHMQNMMRSFINMHIHSKHTLKKIQRKRIYARVCICTYLTTRSYFESFQHQISSHILSCSRRIHNSKHICVFSHAYSIYARNNNIHIVLTFNVHKHASKNMPNVCIPIDQIVHPINISHISSHIIA
jgi:hypothetical protein